jgi:hypothetical protein
MSIADGRSTANLSLECLLKPIMAEAAAAREAWTIWIDSKKTWLRDIFMA